MAVALGDVWALAWLAYPTTVLLLFVVLSLFRRCQARPFEHPVRRLYHVSVTLALSVFFVLSLTQAIVTSLLPPDPSISTALEDIIVGQIACALVFGAQLNQFLDAGTPPRHACLGPWFLSLFWEVFLGSWAIAARPTDHPLLPGDIANFILAGLRCLLLVMLICLIVPPPRGLGESCASSTECQPLLSAESLTASIPNNQPTGEFMAYGSTHDNAQGHNTTTSSHEHRHATTIATSGSALPRCADTVGVPRIIDGTVIFLSYICPFGIRRLQLRGVGLVICILSVACLNVMIPRQIGLVIDSCLTPGVSTVWAFFLILALMCLAISASGLGLLRQWLWTPLRSFANESMICSAYSHTLHLSADFHDSKSTPEISRAMVAANGLSGLVETLLFKLVPALLDMALATIYLSVTLGSFHGLITAVVGILFFLLANRFMKKSTTHSRRKKEALGIEALARYRGLAMWHDSDAIGQLGFEDNRHTDFAAARQVVDVHYERFWVASLAIETTVLMLGLGSSGLLAIYHVWAKQATTGQLAMLLSYWIQLTVSLVSLANQGKYTSDELIEAEDFIRMMTVMPTVKNQGKPLKYSKGDVEFNQVCFGYSDRVPFIKDFNLLASAGQTIAFVGPPGAGKSTLLKLLRRSYDVTHGSIRIDGQDIRSVDLHSLRDRIAMVPQSPVLFDDTIMNNIRYGLITASDEEVHAACKAACIHSKIQTLSEGYDTRVGEYGVKLSSGEIQLIAVARAILKRPNILVVDEATSALDDPTEQQLQTSLFSLCQGLTKFIVTNRPATAMKADLILVIEDGQILEQGTHKHLLRVGGKYASMFLNQVPFGLGEQSGPVGGRSAGKLSGDRGAGDEPGTKQNVSSANTALEASQNRQEALSTKDKSRLNPIAPTFTPRGTRLVAKTQRGASSSDETNTESQPRLASSQTSCQWSDEVTAEEERRKSAEEAPSTIPDRESETPCGKEQVKSGASRESESIANAQSSGDQEAPDHVSSLNTVQLKYPRYSRRIQSKSEPSHEPTDAESKQNLISNEASEPEKHSPLLPQQRRVSAPALKHAQNKTKIARLAKKGQTDTGCSVKNERHPTAGAEVLQPKQNTSREADDQVGTDTPPVGQTEVEDPVKKKGDTPLPGPDKEPSSSNGAHMATLPRSQGHRGGRRGRGSRYHGRRRVSRKPSSAIAATPTGDMHA